MDLTTKVYGGPGKITDVDGVIHVEGPIVVTPKPVYRDNMSAVGGKGPKVLVDLTVEIAFTPMPVWNSTYRGVLFPTAFYNFTAIGGRMVGTSNRAVSIQGTDAQGFTFTRARLTKMPDIYLGLGKPLYGPAVITAYIGTGKALSDADAFGAVNTTAWDQSDFPTAWQEAQCQLALGILTGWDTVNAEDGFQLTHELESEAAKMGQITVDQRIQAYRAKIEFRPEQPTTAQLLANMVGGNIGVIGTRTSANNNSAVITGSGISVTAANMAIEESSLMWDAKSQRHGPVTLRTAQITPATRLTLA